MAYWTRSILLFPITGAFLAIVACSPAPDSALDSRTSEQWLSDLVIPIESATFSLNTTHFPGAERSNAPGSSQGFLFVNGSAGRPLTPQEPVLAVAAGEVIRIDHDYTAPDPSELEFWAGRAESPGFSGAYARDQLRGRQVWIRHESEHISRYAHLSRVHPDLNPGDSVESGQPIGVIGNSGLLPAEPGTEPEPRLMWELWTPDGSRHLGQDLAPLDVHIQIATLFSDQALPRYAREVIARIQSGGERPPEYPPDPLPEVGFTVNLPDSLPAGNAFAISVNWENDNFAPEHLFAFLNGNPLGVIDAGDGAWILGATPIDSAGRTMQLTLGAIDPFGKTLLGGREIQPGQPEENPDPLLVDAATFGQYSEENRQYEAQQLAQVSLRSLQQLQPQWDQPFRAPLEGDIVGDFAQKRFQGGPTRPDHPRPGILVQPDAPTAVMASNPGTVRLVDTLPIRGRTVAISHGGGVISVYSGFSEIEVAAGDRVDRGQPLGRVDQQLQWEIHVGLTPSNPVPWMADILPVTE